MGQSAAERPIVSGIVCEFNPLHLGHRLLISEAGRAGPVVCVMSGNFVQRGEPAIADKWVRARMALENGADLVIELPLPFATAGAQAFAAGSVNLLAALGVKRLCFGSESGSLANLQGLAQLFKTQEYAEAVREQSARGISFAAARESAVKALLGKTYKGELSGSNNNLAIEYLLAMPEPMEAYTVRRAGGGHDEAYDGAVCSAMHIRRLIAAGSSFERHVPPASAALLAGQIKAGCCPASFSNLERAVLAVLRTLPSEAYSRLPDISEGIENKLHKAVKSARSLTELYELVKSKRYSHARIRRLVLHAFLGVTAQAQVLSYIRILGMNPTGEQVLRRAAKKGLPIIGKAADIKGLPEAALAGFALEARATDLYALASPQVRPCGMEYTQRLVRLTASCREQAYPPPEAAAESSC